MLLARAAPVIRATGTGSPSLGLVLSPTGRRVRCGWSSRCTGQPSDLGELVFFDLRDGTRPRAAPSRSCGHVRGAHVLAALVPRDDPREQRHGGRDRSPSPCGSSASASARVSQSVRRRRSCSSAARPSRGQHQGRLAGVVRIGRALDEPLGLRAGGPCVPWTEAGRAARRRGRWWSGALAPEQPEHGGDRLGLGILGSPAPDEPTELEAELGGEQGVVHESSLGHRTARLCSLA